MATDLQTAQTTLDAAQKQALDIQASLNANDLVDNPNSNLEVTDNVTVDNAAGDTINTAVTAQERLDEADRLAQEKLDEERKEFETASGAEEGTSTTQTLIDMIGGKGAPEVDKAGAELEAQEDVGFQKKSDDVLAQDAIVATLNAELSGDKAIHDEALAANRERQTDMSSIRGTQARMNRDYNKVRARKLATLGIEYAKSLSLQGKLDSAQDMVDKAVENYVYDKTYEIARFDKVNELLFDWKVSLDSKDQAMLDQAREDLITERDEIKAEKKDVLNLMLTSPSAGITVDDTVEEATKKAADYAASQEVDDEAGEEMTDNQIRAQIVLDVQELGGKKDEATYNRLKAEITLNENILNQDRALFILDEQFDKAGGKTFDQWKAGEPATSDEAEPVMNNSIFGSTSGADLPEGALIKDASGKLVIGTNTSMLARSKAVEAKKEEDRKKVQELLTGNPLTRKSQYIFSPENLKITNLFK